MGGVREDVAAEAMRLAGHKLPIKTRFVSRIAEGAVTHEEPDEETSDAGE
jgi:large subunit ribosomal protein L16